MTHNYLVQVTVHDADIEHTETLLVSAEYELDAKYQACKHLEREKLVPADGYNCNDYTDLNGDLGYRVKKVTFVHPEHLSILAYYLNDIPLQFENEPLECPECNSEEINSGFAHSVKRNKIMRTCDCEDCGHLWDEYFSFQYLSQRLED